ncbi:MAG: DUF3800 domain-containing protein [Verrucomicrobia bacterium]|nr:DUF3800 domain-containing protein [Verrucomicrobiota bacterium]
MRNIFSDYIIFADESGDHGIASINPENPVFVLAFCIFRKADYISVVNQAVTKFKMDFWGHDLVVLHNHEIRKSTGEFVFLFDEEVRRIFLHALNEMVRNIPFYIAATAIDKRYLSNIPNSANPYVLALGSCLKQTLNFLLQKQQHQLQTHIIVESRGKPEDRDLRLAFDRIAAQVQPERYPLDIRFANKQTNSSGLQIADLVAHPIARHIVKRSQPNKAFDIVKEKLLGYPEYEETGLKYYPSESEKPRTTPRQDADRELPIHL